MKMKKLSEDHYIVVDDSNKEMYTIPTSEAKELLGEVDVEKKAKEFATRSINPINPVGTVTCLISQNGYEKGYNQALEDNKEKKYTEDDMRKAMVLYSAWITGGAPSLRIAETAEQRIEQIIQSLQPQTQWKVEFVDGKLKLKS